MELFITRVENKFLGEKEIESESEETADPEGKEGKKCQGKAFGHVLVTYGDEETENPVINKASHKMDSEMSGHLPVEGAHLVLAEGEVTVEEVTGGVGGREGNHPGEVYINPEEPGQEVDEGCINSTDLYAYGGKPEELSDSALGMEVFSEETLHAGDNEERNPHCYSSQPFIRLNCR